MSKFGFYKNKRVFITGNTGFKGSWLSLWLKELGAEVLGYAFSPPTRPNFFEAVGLDKKIDHIKGDIRDTAKLSRALRSFNPEFIFHLAAQSLVKLSYQNPKLTYETNLLGTLNVLEEARKLDSLKVLINITSDKCYAEKGATGPYKESDPLGGRDPYSSSKGCAELLTFAYRHSFFDPGHCSGRKVALSCVRAGNVIGGGDWARDRIIPDCVRAFAGKKTLSVRNPAAVRPWQYILECLSGYLWLGIKMYRGRGKFCGAWNFGPKDKRDFNVEQLVRLIIRLWGEGRYLIDKIPQHHEASILRLDCSKAKRFLKWAPVYDIQAAVEKTTAWYRRYYSSADRDAMYDFSVAQLRDYLDAAAKKKIEWSTA